MKTIIQAQPGWNVVVPLYEENSDIEDIDLEPVIAWLVNYDDDSADAVPITAIERFMTDIILQRPDGSFSDYGENYIDKDAVIKCLCQRQKLKNQSLAKYSR